MSASQSHIMQSPSKDPMLGAQPRTVSDALCYCDIIILGRSTGKWWESVWVLIFFSGRFYFLSCPYVFLSCAMVSVNEDLKLSCHEPKNLAHSIVSLSCYDVLQPLQVIIGSIQSEELPEGATDLQVSSALQHPTVNRGPPGKEELVHVWMLGML